MTAFNPGDKVRVVYLTDSGHTAWYHAEVVGPSTQRDGDYEVTVTAAGPHSRAVAGSRLSPILGHGVDMVPDDN